MNQLDFLNNFYQTGLPPMSFRILVTGSDLVVRECFLQKVLSQSKNNNQAVIIIDDSDRTMFSLMELQNLGYVVRNGMAEGSCLYDIFPINIKTKWLQLRKISEVFNYNEDQKSKLMSYFDFISYLEQISDGGFNGDITIKILEEYSSNIQVGMKIQSLAVKGIIDDFQKEYLLSKYAEVCSAGADFEHRLLMLEPLISGEPLYLSRNEAILYSISKYDGDSVAKRLVMTLLLEFIKENQNEELTIIVFDKGYGDRNCLVDFIKEFPSNVEVNLFSEDIFTLCSRAELNMIYNRFPVRVYSRHSSEASCEAVEIECGNIDVVKSTYAVTYDRRWRSNRPIDVLLGNNKQEVYTTDSPIREPRYRKEMVASFSPGTGIIEYMGRTLLFSV